MENKSTEGGPTSIIYEQHIDLRRPSIRKIEKHLNTKGDKEKRQT